MALAVALGQSTASCTYSTATCSAQTAANQPTYVMTCQTILSTGAQISAECR
jgi:hypothetical protein